MPCQTSLNAARLHIAGADWLSLKLRFDVTMVTANAVVIDSDEGQRQKRSAY